MNPKGVPFPPAQLGIRMREQRLRMRLGLDDLARQANLSSTTVRQMERGRGGCHAAVLLAVADVLGVSVDWLLGRDIYAPEARTSLTTHPDDLRTLRLVADGLAAARDPRTRR